jgi:hypothetical protein
MGAGGTASGSASAIDAGAGSTTIGTGGGTGAGEASAGGSGEKVADGAIARSAADAGSAAESRACDGFLPVIVPAMPRVAPCALTDTMACYWRNGGDVLQWWRADGNAKVDPDKGSGHPTSADPPNPYDAQWTGRPSYATGEKGQAFCLAPGSSLVASGKEITSLADGNSLGVDFWVATGNADQPATAVVSVTETATGNQVTFELDGKGSYQLRVQIGGAGAPLLLPLGPASSASFQHLGMTYNGANLTVTSYFNGQVRSHGQSPALFSGKDPPMSIRLGGSFAGLVDELHTFNWHITDCEVNFMYRFGPGGMCDN